MESPASRLLIKDSTGTRVPRKTGVPLTTFGSIVIGRRSRSFCSITSGIFLRWKSSDSILHLGSPEKSTNRVRGSQPRAREAGHDQAERAARPVGPAISRDLESQISDLKLGVDAAISNFSSHRLSILTGKRWPYILMYIHTENMESNHGLKNYAVVF